MQLAESGTGNEYNPNWNQVNPNQLNATTNVSNESSSAQVGQQQIGVINGIPVYMNPSPNRIDQTSLSPAEMLLPAPEEPAVDRFADKTAHLLQQASRKSIHWVVSWFSSTSE
ncbi:hypothetical protein D3C78_1513640 [compost metagenome]